MLFRRIIGESPPQYGGKVAYATIGPNHVGCCALLYSLGNESKRVEFASYRIALTAATLAIFCVDTRLAQIKVVDNDGEGAASFPSAKEWFRSVENELTKSHPKKTPDCFEGFSIAKHAVT